MEVNAQKIKGLRQDKGWTQQHMADACGLSLRTVQRAENYGNCSADTLQAISSVLEVELRTLKLVPYIHEGEAHQTASPKGKWVNMLVILIALLIGFAGGFGVAINV
ncbi:helix-turn-helix transcriptional regulator [Alteromonas sp. KUL49]|uniref:helix-turn-helix domain-containing protein n=1 Tax=Alteromonas sp. KUL49 TaxID=2480798 RepID=UPI00102EF6DF|nr:helix-turn-helix transcriptional regulator [Alteromonas sp. KUL49]TAP39413.1 XRE family transcriptional regulator [Alteromonas sp. KUL49]GEA12210.1 hypothetical protein KUL49_25850 [Alteromonas sp. KUL49]